MWRPAPGASPRVQRPRLAAPLCGRRPARPVGGGRRLEAPGLREPPGRLPRGVRLGSRGPAARLHPLACGGATKGGEPGSRQRSLGMYLFSVC